MAWRTAHALDVLRNEVNTRWPYRSKISDGTIGDAAHAARTSDHNPWLVVNGVGVVRAFDCTANGIDPDAYAEHLRALGKAGDPRLTGGGYVIWNKRIASERQGWAWRKYTGANGHTHHIHLSLSRNQAGFDSRASWGITELGRPKPPPPPAPDRNAGRPYRTFAAPTDDATIYKVGGRDNQVAEAQILFGVPVTGRYETNDALSDAVVNLKTLAGWRDASGAPDRSSRVDERFIKAVRALVASG